MSLNGLDAPQITEAYESVTTETGGWFLLKYTSRDEVDVLETGSGDLAETRRAVEGYEEKSPLYGLVGYRRKKVLIKYVPSGTSRLLQARVAVHFQSIVETFQHDAVLTAASASELQESAFSAAISALKATGSVKSSDSSKSRRRLTGIQEDADEGPGSEHVTKSSTKDHNSAKAEEPPALKVPIEAVQEEEPRVTQPHKPDPSTQEQSRPSTATAKGGPRPAESETPKADLLPFARPSVQINDRPSSDRRQSSQSLRPSLSDIPAAYRYKPKIKVGPRPSAEQTPAARPVSTLPAGIQMPQRQSRYQPDRPKTQGTPSKPFFTDPEAPPPVPTAVFPNASITIDQRPPSRAGSAITVPAYTHYPESMVSEADTIISSVTPEKQRLMKALQKRKKARMAKVAAEEQKAQNVGPTSAPAQPATTAEEASAEHMAAGKALETSSATAEEASVVHTAAGKVTKTSSATEEAPPTQTENKEALDPPTAAENVPGPPMVAVEDATKSEAVQVSEGAVEETEAAEKAAANHAVTGEASKLNDGAQVVVAQESLTIPQSVAGDETPKALARDLTNPDPEEDKMHLAANDRESLPASLTNGNAGVAEAYDALVGSPRKSTIDGHTGDVFDQHGGPKGASDDDASQTESTTDLKVVDQSPDIKEAPAASDHPQPLNTQNLEAQDKQMKRRGMVTPIKTGDISDATSLSGDSFLEELQTATVEEAKPIIVSKSPATHYFPLSPKSVGSQRSSEGTKAGRSPSNAVGEGIPPVPSNAGSPTLAIENRSGSFGSLTRFMTNKSSNSNVVDSPHKTQPDTPNGISSGGSSTSLARHDSPTESIGPKKTGMSSGISARIKALEKFAAPAGQSSAAAPKISQSMVGKRKASLNTPPTSAGTDARGNSRPSSPAVFPTPSPSPHESILNRRFRPSRQTSYDSAQQGMSVTATIVRDDSNLMPEQPSNAAEPQAMNLHLSPLKVQHKTPSLLTKTPKKEKGGRSKSKSSSSSSLPSPRDSGPSTKKRDSMSSKRDSMSSRRSGNSSRKDSVETVRPQSVISLEGAAGPEGDKKDGKKRSLLKRMSNITFSRRSIAQTMNPTLNDQPIIEYQEPEPATGLPSAVDIGDLNVQFPDTLFWKRRHLEVDAQGYLILAPSSLDKSSRIGTKKFHISDFKRPYMPEADREELPNSVILDFLDSSTLQCACETASDQANVLEVLQSAHRAFPAP